MAVMRHLISEMWFKVYNFCCYLFQPVTYYGEEIGMVDVFIPYNEIQDPKGKNHGLVRI